MTKQEIFDDVVEIMKTDSSCCKDKKGADASLYRKKINEDMSDLEFKYTVSSYLASFGLTGHLTFNFDGCPVPEIRVKRFNDELYIYKVADNSRFEVGDKIVGIDGNPIKNTPKSTRRFCLGRPKKDRAIFGVSFSVTQKP